MDELKKWFLALRNRWLYHVAVKEKYLLFHTDSEFILFICLRLSPGIYVLKQN